MAWKVGRQEVKRTGVRRKRRSTVVRKRKIAPYGRELHVTGVK